MRYRYFGNVYFNFFILIKISVLVNTKEFLTYLNKLTPFSSFPLPTFNPAS